MKSKFRKKHMEISQCNLGYNTEEKHISRDMMIVDQLSTSL